MLSIILKSIKRYSSVILSIMVILLIIYARECTTNNLRIPKCEESKTDSIVIKTTDTVYLAGKTVYYPKPYAVYDTIHDTIFRTHKDTVAAIVDYAKQRNYRLNVIADSNGKIDVLVDVKFNKISSWTYQGTIYSKHTVIERNHYVMEQKRLKVFAGLQTGYIAEQNRMLMAPTIHLLTSDEHLYSVGYDPFSKVAEIGIYWKIQLKK